MQSNHTIRLNPLQIFPVWKQILYPLAAHTSFDPSLRCRGTALVHESLHVRALDKNQSKSSIEKLADWLTVEVTCFVLSMRRRGVWSPFFLLRYHVTHLTLPWLYDRAAADRRKVRDRNVRVMAGPRRLGPRPRWNETSHHDASLWSAWSKQIRIIGALRSLPPESTENQSGDRSSRKFCCKRSHSRFLYRLLSLIIADCGTQHWSESSACVAGTCWLSSPFCCLWCRGRSKAMSEDLQFSIDSLAELASGLSGLGNEGLQDGQDVDLSAYNMR